MSVIDAADGYALHESKRIWEAQLVYDEPFRYYEPSTGKRALQPPIHLPSPLIPPPSLSTDGLLPVQALPH